MDPASAESQLNAREMRQWNRLADKMDMFHTMFKNEFNQLYDLADGSYTKFGLDLSDYLQLAQSLNHRTLAFVVFDETTLNAADLTLHHTLEERYIFPTLGKYLPQFSKADDGAHLQSHHDIHEGLEGLEKLTEKWSKSPTEYSPEEMRACLNSFREVLFYHLDEEVRDLQGDNLRKHMTLQDLNRIAI